LEICYQSRVDKANEVDWELEGEKETDVNKWRDELAKALFEQTGVRSYVFIDNL
jgi:hypothetical protein